MKVICLGGALAGFNRDSNAASAGDLKRLAQPGERIVLLCHGAPYDHTSTLFPEIKEYELSAVVLTHRNDATSPLQLEELQKDLRLICRRVFGLTRGWNTLTEEEHEKVIAFLIRDDLAPADADLQALFGMDSPVSKLAFRVALEIALRELEARRSSRNTGMQLNAERLLSPAIAVAQHDAELAPTADELRKALTSDTKALRDHLRTVLASLKSQRANV